MSIRAIWIAQIRNASDIDASDTLSVCRTKKEAFAIIRATLTEDGAFNPDLDRALMGLPLDVDEWTWICRKHQADDWIFDVTEHPLPAEPELEVVFTPQAWVNDYAMTVDPEGPRTWLVEANEIDPRATDNDYLRYSRAAPQWVIDWGGPFEIDFADPAAYDALMGEEDAT